MAKIQSVEQFSGSFEAYIQSGNLNFLIGSGASLPAIGLVGNIEAEINELLEAGDGAGANLRALNFIEELEAQHSALAGGAGDADTAETLGNYVEFLSTIDSLLFERKSHLLPRQANVFTTNYDLFVEHAATSSPSLILNDGFDRTSSLAGDYRFAPEQYLDRTFRAGSTYARHSEVPTVNLFKLHGSLNWHRTSSKISLRKEQFAALGDDDLADEAKVATALNDRALILPNLIKFGSSLLDRTYYDLLRIFANSIEKENAVLLAFGFSFADEHILDVTVRALRNPTSELIVFAHSQTSTDDLEQKFDSQRNVLIVNPGDGEVIDFPKFNSLLKGVTPPQPEDDD
jgi:SIR2-like domain